ncbi:ubiquinol oxidase subunit II [Neochlamydia sp. AcF84]|uniref:ubiquinol oxidase subunit II n=1 Tax=Neochlamydia sp. AcF84 TaxID=2315858 RepID=UPI00140AE026|nr:ubiquinol oxidase subunit II [Neochlamydia sp. AcF84]
MNKIYKSAFFIVSLLAIFLVVGWFVHTSDIAVLNPKGAIAQRELDLIIQATLLMLIVVIPVFILMIVIACRYRASNSKAKYTPDWDHSHFVEFIWWAIPFVIVLVLSVITWKSSFELDPFKPLQASAKPLTIQAVALQWKWLFIYPEQKIATVNFLQFPKDTPLNFEVTADAPMNAFWIPQLGGQVYAMPGMKAKLHLIAHELGSFRGSSANFSGEGFAGMKFTAKATSSEDFEQWVEKAKQSPKQLSLNEYKKLILPTQNSSAETYILQKENLFDWILMSYMMPMGSNPSKSDASLE